MEKHRTASQNMLRPRKFWWTNLWIWFMNHFMQSVLFLGDAGRGRGQYRGQLCVHICAEHWTVQLSREQPQRWPLFIVCTIAQPMSPNVFEICVEIDRPSDRPTDQPTYLSLDASLPKHKNCEHLLWSKVVNKRFVHSCYSTDEVQLNRLVKSWG